MGVGSRKWSLFLPLSMFFTILMFDCVRFLWRSTTDPVQVQVYKWTGKNDYFALCETDYISFGGGFVFSLSPSSYCVLTNPPPLLNREGAYGLYLDDTLSEGSSAKCSTFDNEPLCSPGPRQGGSVRFECVGLEVWGVG